MKTLPFYVLALLFLLASCSKDTMSSNDDEPLAKLSITEEVIDNLEKAQFNTEDVTSDVITHPDGTSEAVYLVEGDIALTPEKLQKFTHLHSKEHVHNRQYSTDELVSNNQTIKVLGYRRSSSQYSLSGDMRTALNWSIANYNALNIGLDFELSYGSSNLGDYDIVVYQVHNNQAGGSSGFPNDGAPHKWVRIYNLTEGYNNNVIEHVITHEIGHAVGLRHTDWFSRQSCGNPSSGESVGTMGANFIPGTQPAYDPNSLMLACFDDDEDGEFGYYDKKALEFLY